MSEFVASLENKVNIILASLFYVLVGFLWSRQAVSRGTFGFDLGYILVAVIVSRVLVAKFGVKTQGKRAWFFVLAPGLSVFLIEGMATYSLVTLHERLTVAGLAAFSIFSSLFLLTVLLLIVNLNFTCDFQVVEQEHIKRWRWPVIITGISLAILVILCHRRSLFND